MYHKYKDSLKPYLEDSDFMLWLLNYPHDDLFPYDDDYKMNGSEVRAWLYHKCNQDDSEVCHESSTCSDDIPDNYEWLENCCPSCAQMIIDDIYSVYQDICMVKELQALKPACNPIHYADYPETKEEIDEAWERHRAFMRGKL